MEYSAGIVSSLFWFIETRETAKLLQNNSFDEIARRAVEDNIYHQTAEDRMKREFNCIKRRLQALPDCLIKEMTRADVDSAKLIAFIGVMATDLLLFEFVYEVYRDKLRIGEDKLEDKDFNIFFKNKAAQSSKVAGWSESGIKKIKQSYGRYMFEAGLIEGTKNNKKIHKVFVDQDIRNMLVNNGMEKYLYAVTGER